MQLLLIFKIMSKTIRIAGVGVRQDKLSKLSYDQLFKLAKRSPQFRSDPKADKKIESILNDHGLFASVPERFENGDVGVDASKTSEQEDFKPRKRNRKSSKK